VAVTDRDWFDQLRGADISTVNFWSPTPWNPNLANLEIGSPFCFMVKGHRKIGGYGFFQSYENLRVSEAWAKWGQANGVQSSNELVQRTSMYARRHSSTVTDTDDPIIGCFVLTETVYFDDLRLVDASASGIDFADQIVKYKYFFDDTPEFVREPFQRTPRYRRADEFIATEAREPFLVDPDVVDRGLREHRVLQNAVADFATESGFSPQSPSGDSPNFDLAWWDGDTFVVVEVKSLSATNEVGQMRLGIGQILDYAFHYQSAGQAVRAVLAVEREPDARWFDLCNQHGIRLIWPGTLELAFL